MAPVVIKVNAQELRRILDATCVGENGFAELGVTCSRDGDEWTFELAGLNAKQIRSDWLLAKYSRQ